MPTLKQKAVAKRIVENQGMAVSVAMLEAGYDPLTAKNPKNLTDSRGWQELMEVMLPDDKILKTHAAAFDATKWNDFTGEREPDHTTRLKAVDLSYKVKKKVDPQNNIQINNVIPILGGISKEVKVVEKEGV